MRSLNEKKKERKKKGRIKNIELIYFEDYRC